MLLWNAVSYHVATRFMAITKSSDHTTSVLCFFHYHLMYQKHRFYTCELSYWSTPRSGSALLYPKPPSHSCHANEACVATLIFSEAGHKAQFSPPVGEPGVQFLSCHGWLILNSAYDDTDSHFTSLTITTHFPPQMVKRNMPTYGFRMLFSICSMLYLLNI